MSNVVIFSGSVEKGMGLGKKLGFPTFNLHVDPLPELAHGVYAVRVQANGRAYHALMHFGPKPTVSMEAIFCEVYILEFSDDVEVHDMEVEVLGKLRDVIKFDGLDALIEQMKKDEKYAVEHYFRA